MSDAQLDAIKLPPHSIEAEQSVLGGLLLDNSAWDRIADVIAESDFYRHDHRLIFRHIFRLLEGGKPADVITVSETLENSARARQRKKRAARQYGPHSPRPVQEPLRVE